MAVGSKCGAGKLLLTQNNAPLLYQTPLSPQLNHTPGLWTQPNLVPALGQGWSRSLALHTPAGVPWPALHPLWPGLLLPESSPPDQAPPAPSTLYREASQSSAWFLSLSSGLYAFSAADSLPWHIFPSPLALEGGSCFPAMAAAILHWPWSHLFGPHSSFRDCDFLPRTVTSRALPALPFYTCPPSSPHRKTLSLKHASSPWILSEPQSSSEMCCGWVLDSRWPLVFVRSWARVHAHGGLHTICLNSQKL